MRFIHMAFCCLVIRQVTFLKNIIYSEQIHNQAPLIHFQPILEKFVFDANTAVSIIKHADNCYSIYLKNTIKYQVYKSSICCFSAHN